MRAAGDGWRGRRQDASLLSLWTGTEPSATPLCPGLVKSFRRQPAERARALQVPVSDLVTTRPSRTVCKGGRQLAPDCDKFGLACLPAVPYTSFPVICESPSGRCALRTPAPQPRRSPTGRQRYGATTGLLPTPPARQRFCGGPGGSGGGVGGLPYSLPEWAQLGRPLPTACRLGPQTRAGCPRTKNLHPCSRAMTSES